MSTRGLNGPPDIGKWPAVAIPWVALANIELAIGVQVEELVTYIIAIDRRLYNEVFSYDKFVPLPVSHSLPPDRASPTSLAVFANHHQFAVAVADWFPNQAVLTFLSLGSISNCHLQNAVNPNLDVVSVG